MLHFSTDWKRRRGKEAEAREMPSSPSSPSAASPSAPALVAKATSDLLTGPDWTVNMDICDSANGNSGQARDVINAVKKRLQHKNPMVQFLALTLLETMIKNCGDYVHFQVVECEIPQEMVKMVKKKTDKKVRDTILVLLDSWQEAFGGPQGKYSQYFWAYAELKGSGVQFPQRSRDSVPIFTPPVTHPAPVHTPASHGKRSSSSVRLSKVMSSGKGKNVSLSEFSSIWGVMELLQDMLQAVNPNNCEAVNDEVIIDLVRQCCSNQKKIMQLINTTGDEELLSQGLVLNDDLQNVIMKYNALVSGSPLHTEVSDSIPEQIVQSREVAQATSQSEEDEDDGFTQLARRNLNIVSFTSDISSTETGEKDASTDRTDVTTDRNRTTALSFTPSNALALPDPPTPLKTATNAQDVIISSVSTLSINSSPHTSTTSSSAYPLSPSHISPYSATFVPAQVPPILNIQGHTYVLQTYPVNQGYSPCNSYIVPWAQQPLPPHAIQPQLRPLEDTSSYPPPPWETSSSTESDNLLATPNDQPQQNSYDLGGDKTMENVAETLSLRSTMPSAAAAAAAPALRAPDKPYILPQQLFQDLGDLGNADGVKSRAGTSSLLGSASEG